MKPVKTGSQEVIMSEPASRSRTAKRDFEIWQRYADGETQSELAEAYGLGQSTISDVIAKMRDDIPAEERRARQRRQLAELDHLRGEAMALADADPIPAYSNGRPILMGDGETVAEDHTARMRAMDLVLKLQDREAKALGLDQPTKVSIEAQNLAEELKGIVAELFADDEDDIDLSDDDDADET